MSKRKSIFAVCDLEVEYAYNFMEYLNQKRSVPFEVQAFTGAEVLCAYGAEHPIEILLISDKAMTEEVRKLPVAMLVILSEGVHKPEYDQYPSVYKYQSSDEVIREVMSCYGAEQEQHAVPVLLKRETRLIGVYSPVGRAQKTSFALTMGQILARERAVLYLNLESFSGFEQLLQKSYEKTLSDVLYYVRQENVNLIHKISGVTQSMQNLDFIPPALSPMDIQSTTCEEWEMLLDALVRESGYEVVILDLGDGVADLFQILERCSQIYVPIRGDVISQAKLTQMEQLLKSWDYNGVLDRMQRIKLPFHSTNRIGAGYFEELVWSELGDYVRKLLRKESNQ
ncbi:MAG: hypothetical protein PHG16_07120 [Lachnospiraceae bacterium]|nr:hypothetical protein [Lachnospiraceae bacterium]